MKANDNDVTDVCNTFHSCLVLTVLGQGAHSNLAAAYVFFFIETHSNAVIRFFIDNYYNAIIERALKALQQSKEEE